MGWGSIAETEMVSYNDTMALSRRQQRTLDRIFEEPARSDVRWQEIETLMTALGAELTEGRGSRIRLALRGVRAVFHRPHPRPETGRSALRSVRRFLTEAGVVREEDADA
jgi:hypothetical protein